MKISIVLAAYNGEKYIKEQLESFCEQTRLPDELVVVDDCSTDSTAIILENFCKKSPFKTIFLKNNENIGSTKSFEKACKHASGDWILFSDQDDYWKKEKIEIFENEIARADNSINLLYSDYEIVDENLQPLAFDPAKLPDYKNPQIESDLAWKFFLTNDAISGCTMCVKREIIQITIPFVSRFHDAWIAWTVSLIGKIKFIDKKLIYYRQHSRQQVGLNIVNNKPIGKHVEENLSKFEKNEKKAKIEFQKLFSIYERVQHTEYWVEKNNILLQSEKINIIANRNKYLKTRIKYLQKTRLVRLFPLLIFFFQGYYKFWHKHPFNIFWHDLIFPIVKKATI